MSGEKFEIIEIPYRQPRNILTRLWRVITTGDLVVDHPNENRIDSTLAAFEGQGLALHRRSEDSLNRQTILSFVPVQSVLEYRLQNAEVAFRRKITPRTVLVWFYSILFMFLPWDLDDTEMVPDEVEISGLVQDRAERGYDLTRREDDHLNMKTVLKFEKRVA